MENWKTIAETAAVALPFFCAIDRLCKLLAVVLFRWSRKEPPLEEAPSVSLVQPITWGASGLQENLRARMKLQYPGPIHHILVCDERDQDSLRVCRDVCAERQDARVTITALASDGLASKIAKMQSGVQHADGEILCFMDDDVAPRPANLIRFVQAMKRPGTGAAFGLACYSNWEQPGSALMSAFVNANALFAYLPLALLTPPFTITGHFFAVWRSVWDEAGGLDGLAAERNDDDHEIARRVRKTGRSIAQTDAIYGVDNVLPGLRDYNLQMQRWSAFVRLWCWPTMTLREKSASLFNMMGNLIPGLALLLAAAAPGRAAFLALASVLLMHLLVYLLCAATFLKQNTPPARWPFIAAAGLFAPVQMLLSPVWGDIIVWRGRRYRVRPHGLLEPME